MGWLRNVILAVLAAISFQALLPLFFQKTLPLRLHGKVAKGFEKVQQTFK